MPHDVFISHSAKDKATADAVCAMLESNGIRCWIAPRDVLPSMEWGEAIIDAIEQCRIMVLVFTANANASPQIRREVERAVNHGVAILPLRMEDVLPGKSLEYFIGNVHWLDALTPPFEAHLKNLAGTIKILLARSEMGDAPTMPHEEKPPSSSSRGPAGRIPEDTGSPAIAAPQRHFWSARAWTWAGGAVSAGLLVAIFVGVHLNSRQVPAGSSPANLPPGAEPNPAATSPPAGAATGPVPLPEANPGKTPAPEKPAGNNPAPPASAGLPDGWYGFANGTSPQDVENHLTERCGSFHRVPVADGRNSFAALCASIGKTCFRVCDWQGADQDCNQEGLVSPNSGVLVYKRDGSRIAYCTSGYTRGR